MPQPLACISGAPVPGSGALGLPPRDAPQRDLDAEPPPTPPNVVGRWNVRRSSWEGRGQLPARCRSIDRRRMTAYDIGVEWRLRRMSCHEARRRIEANSDE